MDGQKILELRKFDPVSQEEGSLDFDQGINDIYIHRRGHVGVGIKFRNPEVREYGWKLGRFECKLAEVEVHQGWQFQRWAKYELKMKEKIKLRTKTKHDYKEGLGESAGQKERSSIREQILSIYLGVVDTLRTSQLSQKPQVVNWCAYNPEQIGDQLQVCVIDKLKLKAAGVETGRLRAYQVVGNRTSYFVTKSWECGDLQRMKQHYAKWGSQNTSYPALLEQLMSPSLEIKSA